MPDCETFLTYLRIVCHKLNLHAACAGFIHVLRSDVDASVLCCCVIVPLRSRRHTGLTPCSKEFKARAPKVPMLGSAWECLFKTLLYDRPFPPLVSLSMRVSSF